MAAIDNQTKPGAGPLFDPVTELRPPCDRDRTRPHVLVAGNVFKWHNEIVAHLSDRATVTVLTNAQTAMLDQPIRVEIPSFLSGHEVLETRWPDQPTPAERRVPRRTIEERRQKAKAARRARKKGRK
jgi:hypothetical protein